jgi:uncharacterized protein YjbI with pentapeptide repeats
MSPEVTAAIIAASVGVLTLAGTLAAQYFGRRATSRDTQQALEEQRKQLDRTLGEQRTRTLNERFMTAAEQLGSDKPAVRLAGVYAMAGLADDWEENRQTCVDVLCAYLRMPYAPDPGQDAPESQRLAFQAGREVRHTAIRVITAHLQNHALTTWQGLKFDFTGAVFDGGDFRGVQFADGSVSFNGAEFSGGTVSFNGAEFSGGTVSFNGAEFSVGTVSFNGAEFSAGAVSFSYAKFSCGAVDFSDARLSGGTVSFSFAKFSGGMVYFDGTEFSSGKVGFSFAEFSGGTVGFSGAKFSGAIVNFGDVMISGGTIGFGDVKVSGGTVDFRNAEFSDGTVDFRNAEFTDGTVYFGDAKFSGGTVYFANAQFSGGTIDFSDAIDWSFPPAFPWTDTPPAEVKLPSKENRP